MTDWFNVDREGLARVLERRGRAFAVFELAQNALDAPGATRVDLTLTPIEGRPLVEIIITDDSPAGFTDLASAYTLYGTSGSARDPEKRGRFCMGDKLVLALCEEAEIVSVKGGVRFDAKGRSRLRRRTDKGTVVRGLMRMIRAQHEEVLRELRRLIAPEGITVTINGEPLPPRTLVGKPVEAYLTTEWADDNGVLQRKERWTQIRIYEPLAGAKAALYEMGIPVCDTGDRFDISVGQKLPLNLDRDGVPAGYLRSVRTDVLNATAKLLRPEDATAPWVRDAAGSWAASRDAVAKVQELRFGPKRVIADPSDREGENLAKAQGYTVVPGGSLSADEWEQVKRHGVTLPAGQVTPSKPQAVTGYETLIPDEHMIRIAVLCHDIAREILDIDLDVVFISSPGASTIADVNCEARRLRFNMGHSALSHGFRYGPRDPSTLSTIVHELAHFHGGSNHLTEQYHVACCDLGAQLALLAHRRPEVFA